MVSGEVTPPRLDLANEDLVRAHLHAIWLAEANLSLGSSLRDLLDVAGQDSTGHNVFGTRYVTPSPTTPRSMFGPNAFSLLSRTISKKPTGIPRGVGRRKCSSKSSSTLRRHASGGAISESRGLAQQKIQNAIIMDMSRTADERRQAERLRREAESQYKLLTETQERSPIRFLQLSLLRQ